MLIFSINISNIINFYIYFNIDLVSINLIILRIWILILIILRQFSNIFINSIYFIFFILNLRLVFSFLSNNIIIFYFFFEWSLIPIFFIIMGWGYQLERLKSRFILLIYTLFASLPLLIIIYIMSNNLPDLFKDIFRTPYIFAVSTQGIIIGSPLVLLLLL